MSRDSMTWRTSEQVQHDCIKILDKPGLLSNFDLNLNFISNSILPDSIRGNLSEASVSVVEMSNSFKWSSNCAQKVIPNGFSEDFISPKSRLLR